MYLKLHSLVLEQRHAACTAWVDQGTMDRMLAHFLFPKEMANIVKFFRGFLSSENSIELLCP